VFPQISLKLATGILHDHFLYLVLRTRKDDPSMIKRVFEKNTSPYIPVNTVTECIIGNRDSVLGTATGYGLDN
jgi:hypothetical protein